MPQSKSFKLPTAVNLSLGDSGQAVIDLQEFLDHFGYLRQSLPESSPYASIQALSAPLEATPGIFDDVTVEALRNYQQFHGLSVTGKLDEATLLQMAMPRCGFPDIPKAQKLGEFVAQGNKWPKTALTYGFQEFSSDLTPQQVRIAIATAFGYWSNVTPLTFREVAIANNPDIVIRFVRGEHGDGSPFEGVGNVLAHAFFPPPNGGSLAGDTHFDEAERWSVNIPASGIDLITVAAHEFGHALGLAHSQIRGALMAPTYNGPQRFLTQDDVNGIQSIYGTPVTLPPVGRPPVDRPPVDNPFPDITNDIYRREILEAVALKFISGFADNSFRPQAFLTREQLVSMSLESLKNISGVNLQIPTRVSVNPFPDVRASRWSAAKITFASANQIVTGYSNGRFRPTQAVTRAEMMAILRRTAEFAKARLGLNPQLQQKQTPTVFSDIRNHWAEAVIRQMSAYCGVASPLNERGATFFPNQSARRNYGAAATLRMLNCLRTE